MNFKNILYYLAIGLLMLFALSSFPNLGLTQQKALYICVPGAFLLTFINGSKAALSKPFRFLIYLYIWECISFLGAEDQQVALDELKRLVACFFMVYSFFFLAKKEKLIPWLYVIYFLYYASMLYYANTNILTDDFDYTEDRLKDKVLNSNLLAYMTFFMTFVIYTFPLVVNNELLQKGFRVLFIFSPILSFVVAILTGSRQVVIIQLPFIAILLYLRYMQGTRLYIKVITVVLLLITSLFFLGKATQIYEQSQLSARMELELDEDPRTVHFYRAVRIGLSHPIMGVGPGNYKLYTYNKRSFSHSSYSELFANNGFPGLILYILLFYFFCKRQWRCYRRTHDKQFLYFFIFGLFYVVDNAFYVMHTAPWLISFFVLVDSYSQTYYKNNYLIKSICPK